MTDGELLERADAAAARARAAMALYAKEISAHGQARIDEAVTALAWSIYKQENARRASVASI